MTDIPPIVAFLTARWDEQEASARALLAEAQHVSLALKEPRLLGKEIPGWYTWPAVETVAEAMLADIATKRTILEIHLI